MDILVSGMTTGHNWINVTKDHQLEEVNQLFMNGGWNVDLLQHNFGDEV